MNIVLDYYTPGVIQFKIGSKSKLNLSKIPSDYESLKSQLSGLPSLDDQGDGFRSFVGIVLGVLLCKKRILLIDEPEVFLHSTQAKVLADGSQTIVRMQIIN